MRRGTRFARKALVVLLLIAAPLAAADDQKLYENLAKLELLKESYDSARKAGGVNFVSKARVTLPSGESHPKYHIEIEGPLPLKGTSDLESLTRAVVSVIQPEVDTTLARHTPIVPGVDFDLVDINGVNVAVLGYRANNDGGPFRKRVVLFAGDRFYIATLSSHVAQEKDPGILALFTVVIEMVNGGEIAGLHPAG